MSLSQIIVVMIIAAAAYAANKSGKLTGAASVTGWVVAAIIFIGSGYAGLIMLAVFFIMGTSATSIGLKRKQQLGLAEKEKGKRTSGQVIANAGVAAILSILILILPAYQQILLIMMAASFSSAAADTLSSELGNVYGRNYYNIITFKKDKRGLDGIVSLEGTMIGVAGSLIIAVSYAAFTGLNNSFALIIVCGTIGNLSDSILGATLERKKYISNNAVNFLNTLVAALCVIAFFGKKI